MVIRQTDSAMRLDWGRIGESALRATFWLGPHSVQQPYARANLVAEVPAGAELAECSYSDLGTATSQGGGIDLAAAEPANCYPKRGVYSQFFSTPLVPKRHPKGLLYLNMTFLWNHPSIRDLGVARDAISLRYLGRLTAGRAAGFLPADSVAIHYDIDHSGQRSGLENGAQIRYLCNDGETITDATPEPDAAGEHIRTWVSNAKRPTYYVTVHVERSSRRRVFELACQGIFLVIGGAVGATFPSMDWRSRIRRRRT